MIKNIKPYNRQILFEGNSLLNLGPVTTSLVSTDYDHCYIPVTVYGSLRATRTLSMLNFAIESRTGTQILSQALAISSIREGDVLVYWEGTNDLYLNPSMTGATAFGNFTSYLTLAIARGAKVIACTIIARDYSLDPADLMARINDYNFLIRNNTALGYTLCDLGANPNFDTRSDCSLTGIYATDKIHLVTAGSDIIASLITASATPLL